MTAMTSLDLTIDDNPMSGEVDGCLIVCNKIDGWYGGVGARTAFEDRPNGHGSFDAPVYRTNRVVSPSGFAYADSRSVLMSALQRMAGLLGEGQLGAITVNDPDYGSLSCQARISGPPMLSWDAFECCWNWQLSFTAPDGRLYGPTVTAPTELPTAGGGMTFPLFDGTGKLEFGNTGDPGRVTLANPGTADAYLTFTITGPVLGGFTLTDVGSGRLISYAGDVPSGATVLIVDSATGRATLNGADRTGELTSRQWWAVPRNGSSTVQFATLGASGQAGTMSASMAPAYW